MRRNYFQRNFKSPTRRDRISIFPFHFFEKNRLNNFDIVALSTLDVNNDQVISKEAAFKKIDKDNSGQISRAELNAYRVQNNSIAAIDADKDGKISKAEAMKMGMSAQEFRILDKDNNGYITQAEWDTGDWIIW